jgi:hypothetical protein
MAVNMMKKITENTRAIIIKAGAPAGGADITELGVLDVKTEVSSVVHEFDWV